VIQLIEIQGYGVLNVNHYLLRIFLGEVAKKLKNLTDPAIGGSGLAR